jgi:hypothetical protein
MKLIGHILTNEDKPAVEMSINHPQFLSPYSYATPEDF